jgi:hypothetical protein
VKNEWFTIQVKTSTVIIFWIMVLCFFAGVYFFVPSLMNRFRQTEYQNTPFVNTPLRPN